MPAHQSLVCSRVLYVPLGRIMLVWGRGLGFYVLSTAMSFHVQTNKGSNPTVHACSRRELINFEPNKLRYSTKARRSNDRKTHSRDPREV